MKLTLKEMNQNHAELELVFKQISDVSPLLGVRRIQMSLKKLERVIVLVHDTS